MKIIGSLFCLVLSALTSFAQVQMDLVLEQKQFVPGEELMVGVRIANLSGQPLRFGGVEDWASFQFDPNGEIRVRSTSKIPHGEPFVVTNATRATRWFDLAPHFDLEKPGYYSVSASVQIRDWQEERSTPPLKLELVRPTTIWEQQFGVPVRPGTPPGPPELRKYMLQRALIDNENRLYVRITDASETKVFRVAGIGRVLQINETPKTVIDRKSQLHVLHRMGRTSFSYSVFNPDGVEVVRQRHNYNEQTGSRPSVRTLESGEVVVYGGVRENAESDIPPSARELRK